MFFYLFLSVLESNKQDESIGKQTNFSVSIISVSIIIMSSLSFSNFWSVWRGKSYKSLHFSDSDSLWLARCTIRFHLQITIPGLCCHASISYILLVPPWDILLQCAPLSCSKFQKFYIFLARSFHIYSVSSCFSSSLDHRRLQLPFSHMHHCFLMLSSVWLFGSQLFQLYSLYCNMSVVAYREVVPCHFRTATNNMRDVVYNNIT